MATYNITPHPHFLKGFCCVFNHEGRTFWASLVYLGKCYNQSETIIFEVKSNTDYDEVYCNRYEGGKENITRVNLLVDILTFKATFNA